MSSKYATTKGIIQGMGLIAFECLFRPWNNTVVVVDSDGHARVLSSIRNELRKLGSMDVVHYNAEDGCIVDKLKEAKRPE